jgi:hypothetical protein
VLLRRRIGGIYGLNFGLDGRGVDARVAGRNVRLCPEDIHLVGKLGA